MQLTRFGREKSIEALIMLPHQSNRADLYRPEESERGVAWKNFFRQLDELFLDEVGRLGRFSLTVRSILVAHMRAHMQWRASANESKRNNKIFTIKINVS